MKDMQIERSSIDDMENEKESDQEVYAGDIDYLICVRNVVANYDIQCQVAQAIDNLSQNDPNLTMDTSFMAEFYKQFQLNEIESYGLINKQYNIPNVLRKYMHMYHDQLEEVQVEFERKKMQNEKNPADSHVTGWLV